ncbi:MAG: hypothetical protein GY705_18205 [Bacteroidetes bacterium]|nr:hypothetical protein [Bacteroidota bacterium]
MKFYKIISFTSPVILLFLTFLLIIPKAQCQNSFPPEVEILEINLQPDEPLTSINFNLKNNQLFLSIKFKGEKLQTSPEMDEKVEPGGQYFLYLDGVIVKQAYFSGKTFSTQEKLPPEQLIFGEHIARLEVHHALGQQFTNEVRFIFNVSATISVGEVNVENGQIATDVSLDFFPTGQEVAGQITILIDNNLVATKPVMAIDNGSTKSLTKWLGKTINIGELLQGKHLLSILFQGGNGGESTIHKSFIVDTIPELKILGTPKGDTIVASFIPTGTTVNGFMDIFYNQHLVISKQIQDQSATVTRAEVVIALQKNEISVTDSQHIPLIVGLRSASNVENWQHVVLK